MRRNYVAATLAAEIANASRFHPRSARYTYGGSSQLCLLKNDATLRKRPIQHLANNGPFDSSMRAFSSSRLHRAESFDGVISEETVGEENARPSKHNTLPASASHLQRTKDAVSSNAEHKRSLFIDLMRTVAHPVAVITARKQDVNDDAQGTVAATVSSFNTVSLHPDLVVSFNLKSDSITHKTICDSKYFAITFPQMNSKGASLVDSFTKGNSPSPFLTTGPDRPTPYPVACFPSDHPAISSNIKYCPPAVSLTRGFDFESSGFAFAFMCEHQASIPVGDHVIVTGRLAPTPICTPSSGWGGMNRKAAWATNFVTLAHVHGTYSSTDTGLGFTNLWKMDDLDLKVPEDDANSEEMVDWYENRLRSIHNAQIVRNHDNSSTISTRFVNRARRNERIMTMAPELLQQYERHYVQRINFWRSKSSGFHGLKELIDLEGSPPVGEIPEKNDAVTRNAASVPFSQLPGHLQLFVRNKTLLSTDELDEEMTLYQKRLKALDSNTITDVGGQDASKDIDAEGLINEDETASSGNLDPEADEPLRKKLLRDHFQERIHLLEHAITRKAEFSSISDSIKVPKAKADTDAQLKRFLGSQRHESIDGLKNKYRRYQLQITEARLCMIGLAQTSGTDADLELLKARIKYFEPRLELIAGLIRLRAQRSTKEALLNEHFKMPTIRAPEPREAKEKVRVRKIRQGGADKLRKQVQSESLTRSRQDSGIDAQDGESIDQLDYETESQIEPER